MSFAAGSGRGQEHDSLAGDRFATSYGSHALAGLRFHVDLVHPKIQKLGEPGSHGALRRTKFGLLRKDDHIYIDELPTGAVQTAERITDKIARFAALIGWVRIGIGVADVAQPCGA